MTTTRIARRSTVISLLAAASLFGAEATRADTFTATFTNEFGNGLWERDLDFDNTSDPNDSFGPGNWSTGAYPSNGRTITNPNNGQVVPGVNPEYNVVFGAGSGCTLGSQVSIRTLDLGSSSILTLASGGIVNWRADSVVNNGSVVVNPTAAGTATGLRFETNPSFGTALLSGSGSIQLNGVNFNAAALHNGNQNTGGGGTLTHGPNHRIHGRGDLVTDDNSAFFYNRGTIEADVNGHALRVYFSGNTSENTGLMRAMNGATLYIRGGLLSQTSVNDPRIGSILSEDGSFVQLGDVNLANNFFRLTGGTLQSVGTGLFEVGSFQADGVTSNATLRVLPTHRMNLRAGGLTNNGTILVNPNAGTDEASFTILASSTLDGTGSLHLNAVDTNDAWLRNDFGFTFTHGAGHLIHGRGDITSSNGVFINHGTIAADMNGGELRIFLGNQAGNHNGGTIQAQNGGTLFLETGRFTQTGNGNILAANGSLVRLGNTGFANNVFRVTGGTVNTSGNGLLQAETFGVNGVTNNGNIQVPAGHSLRLEGDGLTNNGTVLVNTTAGTSGDTQFVIDANTQLDGTGRLQLNGIEGNDAWLRNDFTFTHGAGHLIHGRGDFTSFNGVFINHGTIDADVPGGELRLFLGGNPQNLSDGTLRASNGATLFLETGRFDQTGGGMIVAESGSTVILGNRNFANNIITVQGGTIGTNGTGMIKGQTVNLAGNITTQANFEVDKTHISATKLTNNGTITNKAANSEFNFTSNSTLIEGIGSIALSNGVTMRIENAQDVINGATHTLKGDGSVNVNGSFTNNGKVAPGASAGRLTFNGPYTHGNTGLLEIELGGTTAGTDFDQLVVNGTATLGGQLRISLINGFFPSPADSFKVVQSSQNLVGSFLNVGTGERVNTVGGTGSFIVTYNGKDVVLSSFGPAIAGGGLNLRLANPKMGGDNGIVTMTLVGTGVQPGATVVLRRAGQPDLIGTAVTVSADGTTITARFRLNGQPLGAWDVVVTNPDMSSFVIAGQFTVEAGRQTRLWTDLLHRSPIRFGSFSRFTLVIGNDGNTDAFGVPVFVSGIPSTAQVSLGFGLVPIPPFSSDIPPDWNPGAVPPVINTASNGKVLGLIIPKIPAGSVASYQFTVNVPDARTFNINTFVLSPLLEAADIQSAAHGSQKVYYPDSTDSTFALTINQAALECLGSLYVNGVDCATSFIPGADCLKALFNLGGAASNISQIVNGSADSAGGGAISFSQFLYSGFAFALHAARCGSDLTPLGPLLDIVGCGMNLVSTLYDCAPAIGSAFVTTVGAVDPNDKVGSVGSGSPEHYLTGTEPFRYVVFFENLPNATAPAQHVMITDQLDVSKFDLDTFQLGPISFGTSIVLTPPPGLTEWIVDQDLRPAKNLIARVTATLNKSTGLITWNFYSLDPVTMLPTTDALAGFLPPNQTAPEGDGAVMFTVKLKPGLATGTQIFNQASIVFDTNPAIDTPQWLNTIDNSPPSSQVTALPSTSNTSAISVSWSGSDTGAGVKYYAIYVSENGGAFTLWKNSSETSGVYQGRPNASYAFYSVAVDGAGNFEAPPGPADASTTTLSGRLLNIATRLRVETGENVLIGGVIITGTDPKKVILRAIAPSLAQSLQGTLSDPVLQLFQGNTLIASNDNWKDSQQAEVEATTIPPTNDLESAIVQTLAPGSYTAVLSGKDGATGIAVVEAYDLDQAANSKLANISSRGLVAAGNDVMIGGVIAGGTNNADVRVLIRGIGPSLANAGIQGSLQDPTLDLFDSNGTLLRTNDNWQDTQQVEIQATTIPPTVVTESAIIATLTPGNYTAILRGKNNTGGVGLVEVYNLP